MTLHTRPMSALLSLGLLLTTVAACDGELDELDELELAQRHTAELELTLERQLGVELELLSPETQTLDLDPGDDASVLFTEVTDITTPPAEGACGEGRWQYKSTTTGCDTCQFDQNETGKKYDHYKRWCWDGPPGCGGCGGWQYTGWGCLQGCW